MKITMIGLNNYMAGIGKDLFGELQLPEAVDKDVLVNNILLKAGDFEVLYADAEFMKSQIGYWSKKWQRTFEKWVKALSVEYEPLENYDRIEDWTTTDTLVAKNKGTSDSEAKTSAYDSSEYQPNSLSTSKTEADTDSTNTNIRTGRAHGNIGVTTSQQMLQSELDIATWNLYEHITDMFLTEFIIPIY